jgi:tetratricopeptide (TPR) repeat protein
MTGSTKIPDKLEAIAGARRRKRFLIISALGLVIAVFGARPALVSYHLWQAAGKLKQHHTQQVEPHLATVLELDPQNAQAHFLFARLCRRQGSPEGMQAHLEAALAAGFPAERVDREQQFVLAQTGQFRNLTGSAGELLINSGEDGAEACEAVVNGMMLTYQLSAASGVIDAWAADYPDDAQPLFCRGTIYKEYENWPEAIKAFRQALDLDPDRADIRVHLAGAMKTLQKHESAIREYRRCVKETPSLVQAYVGLAECLLITARADEARTILKAALQIAPDGFDANLALGQLELNSGNSELAVDRLRKAIESRPHSIPARYALASSLRTAGRADEAKEHFDRVEEQNEGQAKLSNMLDRLSKDPDRVNLRYEIGIALLEFGNPAEGAIWLQSVLEFDAQHEQTHAALADYYTSTGEASEASFHRRLANP